MRLLLILFCFLFSLSTYAAEKLIFAVDIIRHGDRTPISEIPASPHVWKEGLGELTAEGMRQEFQLGTQFRKRYVEQEHLLPAQYSAELMYVRSTDFNRTLMSAESLLYGLYPLGTGPRMGVQPALPQAFQPIPINTLPKIDDHLLLNKGRKTPLALYYYVKLKQQWNAKIAPLKSKIIDWNKATGMNLEDPKQMDELGDILYIRQLHHVSLPAGISSDDAKQIIALGYLSWITVFHYPALTTPVGSAILKEINANFKHASQHLSPLKYILFSAHDGTLASLMTALGDPLNTRIPYASHINFALYEDNGNYKVKVSYNDRPVSVPACGGSVCTLEQFSQI